MNTITPSCEELYAIHRWGEGYFHVGEAGHLCARPDPEATGEIDLYRLAEELAHAGLSLPVLVRFNDILRHRVRQLRAAFDRAREELEYTARYTTAYPIKVNQQRSVVEQIVADGTAGLEAGSKPELMVALTLSRPGSLVICNGYKDREYIRLALIGRRLGLRIYIVIEKLHELPLILEEAERLKVEPLLGVRVRLAVSAAGKWQNSGGEKAKFGLSASQVLALVERLRAAGRLSWLSMLHAHLGSQIPNLHDIRNGLQEVARYFAELWVQGAAIDTVDVGGGLGVDYEGSGTRHFCSMNYGLDDYAREVVGLFGQMCHDRGLPQPDLISESGRALTAHHSLLITNLIEREPAPGLGVEPCAEDQGSRLLRGLAEILMQPERSPLEAFEQAQDLRFEMLDGFERGAVGLVERARAEELFFAVCRALQSRIDVNSRRQRELMDRINLLLSEKLFMNFSLFQSMPDVWAIDQIFPIVPLQRLNEEPVLRGVIHDLTCDSDGCIEHYVDRDGVEASLPIHTQKRGEPYLLGVFLLGAYQEILGDIHNLFGDTDAVNVELDGKGGYRLLEPERGDSVDELLSYVHFSPPEMLTELRRKLSDAGLEPAIVESWFLELEAGLYGYTYLEE